MFVGRSTSYLFYWYIENLNSAGRSCLESELSFSSLHDFLLSFSAWTPPVFVGCFLFPCPLPQLLVCVSFSTGPIITFVDWCP